LARPRVRVFTHARAPDLASERSIEDIFGRSSTLARGRRAVARDERTFARVERAIESRDRAGEGIARGVARESIRAASGR